MVAVTVTRASTTRRIASWINRLPPARYQFSCPALSAVEPVETLTFRASATGSTLATATVTDFGGSSDCNPLILSVPGHKDRRLVGGQIVERVERLLGVNFGIGIGVLKGHIYMVGAPAASKARAIPGQILLYLDSKLPQYARQPVSVESIPFARQTFLFEEGPGRYYLRATSPNGQPSHARRS